MGNSHFRRQWSLSCRLCLKWATLTQAILRFCTSYPAQISSHGGFSVTGWWDTAGQEELRSQKIINSLTKIRTGLSNDIKCSALPIVALNNMSSLLSVEVCAANGLIAALRFCEVANVIRLDHIPLAFISPRQQRTSLIVASVWSCSAISDVSVRPFICFFISPHNS